MDGNPLGNLAPIVVVGPATPPPETSVVALNGPRWSAIGRRERVELTIRAEGAHANTHLTVRYTPAEARAIAAALNTLAGEVEPTLGGV